MWERPEIRLAYVHDVQASQRRQAALERLARGTRDERPRRRLLAHLRAVLTYVVRAVAR